MQPTVYVKNTEEEYALSKDVDVVVWLQYRAYNRQPLPRDAFDFVIVTSELHKDFDAFKEQELQSHFSFLVITDLLRFYLHYHSHLQPVYVHMYGEAYLRFTGSQMDDLCLWVYEMRKTFAPNMPQLITFLQGMICLLHNYCTIRLPQC